MGNLLSVLKRLKSYRVDDQFEQELKKLLVIHFDDDRRIKMSDELGAVFQNELTMTSSYEESQETIERKNSEIDEINRRLQLCIDDRKKAINVLGWVKEYAEEDDDIKNLVHSGLLDIEDWNSEDKAKELLLASLMAYKSLNASLKSYKKAFDSEERVVDLLSMDFENFFRQINQYKCSQRRALLDVIAKSLSQKLESFSFLSPEKSLNFNVEIHKNEGPQGRVITNSKGFVIMKGTTIYSKAKVQTV